MIIMKDFFNRIQDKIRTFMIGRYGTDDFSRFLLVATLVLLIISLFARTGIFYILALACLVYAYFRILSKNFAARSAENTKYREVTSRIRKFARIEKRRFAERKEYRFFKCPSCGQEVRVPKGKGHIRITCPKCRTQFDRNV